MSKKYEDSHNISWTFEFKVPIHSHNMEKKLIQIENVRLLLIYFS